MSDPIIQWKGRGSVWVGSELRALRDAESFAASLIAYGRLGDEKIAALSGLPEAEIAAMRDDIEPPPKPPLRLVQTGTWRKDDQP